MKFKYKNLLVPAVMTALYGCGSGSSDNDIVKIENKVAPVLDTSALLVEGNSDAVAYADGVISWMTSTYDNADGKMEWEYRFKESAREFPSNDQRNPEPVDHIEIDLLTGITDADNGSNLTIKQVQFVWEGPDCSNTVATAPEYPEICNPILDALGFIDADGNIVNTIFEDEEEIREYQNLPITNEVIYGFQIKETSLMVTPSAFAPILVNGQTSQLHLIYKVTDGVSTIDRRIKVVIDGEDAAPVFLQRFIDSDEVVIDPDTGESIPQSEVSISLSEKSAPVRFNIAHGIYDQDIEDIQELIAEKGDLTEIYQSGHYSAERLSIIGVTGPADMPAGVFNDVNSVSKWTEERGVTEYTVEIDPAPYADLLSRGEEVDLEFTFQVTDGNNTVDRSFFVNIKGADLVNPPEFDEPTTEFSMSTSAFTTVFNLKSGAIDLDGDNMEVVDFVAAAGSDGYGVDLSNPNVVRIDPYGFLDLAPGEEQVLSYTYKLTDGSLTSDEHTLNITLTGANHNLLHKSEPAHNGFETGSLDGSAWMGGDGAASVASEAAAIGGYGLNVSADSTFFEIDQTGIDQGKIEEGDDYYINFYGKQSNAWGGVRVTFNKSGDTNDSFQIEESPNNGTTDWVEHTLTYLNADEFFQKDSTFDVTFRLGTGTYDNFSLVKYEYTKSRDLIPDGVFTSGNAGGWAVSGDVTLAVTEDANRLQNTDDLQYGLAAEGGAAGGVLYLDSDNLIQGGIKKGMRYILQFDLRNPTYAGTNGADPSPLLARIVDEESGNWVRKGAFAEPTTTAWNTYTYHLNTQSLGTDWNGIKYASDVEFDWENAKVRVEIDIPGDQTFYIDNVKLFPVPQ
ncbi:hypothetical protein RS130_10755 [Paraglaciecola aquimarina]|uniref:CBM-cenC domain-containing protein n=1 Tax=Paraglaciecola aquimarina TaxID=1235557 RepID=A0ABU3SWE4_9ALTE|nr:hypothetical protein [Paraglaciecola aquimarina]MDU0354345.1 hypothetical protein [Paraglaciecola aquimarina]